MPSTHRLEQEPEEAPSTQEAQQEGPETAAEPEAPAAQEVREEAPEAAAEDETPAPRARGRERKAPKGEEAAEAQEKRRPSQSGANKEGRRAAQKEDLTGYVPRLKERYRKEIIPSLMKELSIKNPTESPVVSKVVVNMGLGEALTNPKALESAERDLSAITGQHPVVTKAKKSVAAFKIRKGMSIGMMVTLRGNRMYEFLDRLIHISLPRIRDFRGAPNNGFDGRGNYSMGIREHVMFPEIDYNTIDRIRGLQLTIVTTARTDEEARVLLGLMGMVFSRDRETAVV